MNVGRYRLCPGKEETPEALVQEASGKLLFSSTHGGMLAQFLVQRPLLLLQLPRTRPNYARI